MDKLFQMVSFGWLAIVVAPVLVVALLWLVGAAVSRWIAQ
jgi:hypothetical protein